MDKEQLKKLLEQIEIMEDKYTEIRQRMNNIEEYITKTQAIILSDIGKAYAYLSELRKALEKVAGTIAEEYERSR